MNKNVTESEIQGLKSQEAKDLAIELLHKLHTKQKAPLSAGEVQLKELQYELKLKEAEAEDNRNREAHEQKIKELELQIEAERVRHTEVAKRGEQIRADHAALVDDVRGTELSLSTRLEQATREHNLRIEQLEAQFTSRTDELRSEQQQMEEQKDQLQEQIGQLTDLREAAVEIGELREEIETRRKTSQNELQNLDAEWDAASFKKTKQIKDVQRAHELELAQLEMENSKSVLQENRKAADAILGKLNMIAVATDQWEETKQSQKEASACEEQQLLEIREQAYEEIRKRYNISGTEVIDVTDLHYQHQAASHAVESLRSQVDKLENEIKRMRQHIEHEPERLAAAVEAAKVHVQNTIEPSGKR